MDYLFSYQTSIWAYLRQRLDKGPEYSHLSRPLPDFPNIELVFVNLQLYAAGDRLRYEMLG
jgi:hypothetical protein